ncbi:MAG: hypothetical protein JRJ44_02745 [Deltaproteobacteria bacterium]|nr:hypothetical protein [Deltaproteobacteria bacterium]
MSKYDPLYDYLTKIPSDVSEKFLTFDEIDEIINNKLPSSAYKHHSWWSNHKTSDGKHPCTQLWLEAGWKVKTVDQSKKWV